MIKISWTGNSKIFDIGKVYKRLEFRDAPHTALKLIQTRDWCDLCLFSTHKDEAQPVTRLVTVLLLSVSGKALGAVEWAVAPWKMNALGARQVCLPVATKTQKGKKQSRTVSKGGRRLFSVT